MIKECVADQCECNHEGLCIIDTMYKGFKPEDCNVKSNADLVPACERCEVNPADAKFPFEEYCEECAKEVDKEMNE